MHLIFDMLNQFSKPSEFSHLQWVICDKQYNGIVKQDFEFMLLCFSIASVYVI